MSIPALLVLFTLDQPVGNPDRVEAPPCQGYWLRLTEHVRPEPLGLIFTATLERGGPARMVVVTRDGHTLGVLRGPSAMKWQCLPYRAGPPA